MTTETVFFESINNKRVFCHLSLVPNNSKRMVIMSHGFRGSSLGPARQFVNFQRLLNNEGISVLRFDQPHAGNSEGDFIDSSFKEWIQTIVYLSSKYLHEGYEVILLGQSMGATATVAATHDPQIKDKIPCILLWVPDAKTTIDVKTDEIYEEGAEKYRGRFWEEARDSHFFTCLQEYKGGIHLVYGEFDRYVEEALKKQTIEIVKSKDQPFLILPGQDHSPWEYDVAQQVFAAQLEKIKTTFSM